MTEAPQSDIAPNPAGAGEETHQGPAKGAQKGRRPPKRITPKYLDNVALWYLGRYASSAANLRRILMRRVQRSCAHHGTDVTEATAWVDDLVTRFQRSGLVDDAQYAAARARSLFRRGLPPRRIRGKLAEKGVGEQDIAAAIDGLSEDGEDLEFRAACAYARRRRLGPWGKPQERPERREKELGSLARAGFSWEAARRIIEAESADDLEAA